MRTVRVDGEVEDATPGQRFLLLKESGDACLVRDPATGERRYLPTDAVERVDAPPVALADAPESLRALAARDGRLGLLVDLVDRWDGDANGAPDEDDPDPEPDGGATPVRTLLDETTLCESDLHGALADLEAAGLIDRVERTDPLLGRSGRAYRPTERALSAVERLRS